MDRIQDKQRLIDAKRTALILSYPALWGKMITEWQAPGSEDCAWLLYSANYLFRTDGVRWAIDLVTLKVRVPELLDLDIARDLSGLSFVLLTHSHADHLDLSLLSALRNLPIQWVVPERIFPIVVAEAGLPVERIIIPTPHQPIELGHVRITPFNSLHLEHPIVNGKVDFSIVLKGIPAMAYLVEFNGKRWLFPGDTRTYAVDWLPDFGPVDGVFAHLWLGRDAGMNNDPPLLDAFCQFYLSLHASRIVVTHLEEVGHPVENYWDGAHYGQIYNRFSELAPELQVECAYTGDRVVL